MALDTHREKCQAETVKKALKSLLKPQQHTVDIKSLKIHVSSSTTYPFNISDSEEEVKEELINVDAAH